MEQGSNLSERRGFPRFQVKNPAYVFNSLNVGRIVDISLDGLAFTYAGDERWPQQISELDLLINEEIFLHKVPVRVISDLIVAEGTYRPATRQCGVQFCRLTPDQIYQLEYFIRVSRQETKVPFTVEGIMGSLGYD